VRVTEGRLEERLEVGLIGTEELKEKLDRADDFELVMVLGDWRSENARGTYRRGELPRG